MMILNIAIYLSVIVVCIVFGYFIGFSVGVEQEKMKSELFHKSRLSKKPIRQGISESLNKTDEFMSKANEWDSYAELGKDIFEAEGERQ